MTDVTDTRGPLARALARAEAAEAREAYAIGERDAATRDADQMLVTLTSERNRHAREIGEVTRERDEARREVARLTALLTEAAADREAQRERAARHCARADDATAACHEQVTQLDHALECMRIAGLEAFMGGRPAREVAEHLHYVITSYMDDAREARSQLALAMAWGAAACADAEWTARALITAHEVQDYWRARGDERVATARDEGAAEMRERAVAQCREDAAAWDADASRLEYEERSSALAKRDACRDTGVSIEWLPLRGPT